MKPIKTALTSYGMSGLVFHGPLLETHPGFEITSILEWSGKRRSEGRHPGAMIEKEYDKILKDRSIELVIINSPDHLHHEMAIKALDHGKSIVVEKPFTLTTKQAEEVIGKAVQKGIMVSVFQNRRWDGDFLTVREVIESGSLGRLVSFESHFDRFRNYIQESWKENKNVGAGTLYNLGSHMIDQALDLFGMPEFIFADVRGQRTGSEVDDSFDIFMHYPEVKCLVRGSYLVKEQGPRYILHGTHGSFLKWGLDPQEEALKAGQVPGLKDWGAEHPDMFGVLNTEAGGTEAGDTEAGGDTEKREKIPTIPGNYMAYYDNIYEHLRHGTELAVKAEEARNVIRIIEAAYESAKKGETVRI